MAMRLLIILIMGNSLFEACQAKKEGLEPIRGFDQVKQNTPLKFSRSVPICPSKSKAIEQIYSKLIADKPLEESIENNTAEFIPVSIQINNEEAIYLGKLQDGKPSGPGQIYINSHTFIDAVFVRGNIQCKDGILIQENRDYYRGEFQQSNKKGKGKLVIEGMHQTQGNFNEGVLEGKGERQYIDGSKYVGNFKGGKRHGKGKMAWGEDQMYEGYFVDDAKEGIGYLKTQKYEYWGPFKQDKKEGKGTVKFKDGSKFQGWFENDKVQGYGQLHSDGKIQKGNFSEIMNL